LRFKRALEKKLGNVWGIIGIFLGEEVGGLSPHVHQ